MREGICSVRNVLPDRVRELFDSIVEQRVLGASKHIAMIGDMIEAIAVQGRDEKKSAKVIVEDIKKVAKFFMATRGEASQAVSNAILIMLHEIDKNADLDIETAVDKILETKNNYLQESKEATEKLIEYAAELAKDMEKIFVFDYSSTVESFLTALAESGKKHTVYIAESRSIDGGLPFVIPCQKAGYAIKYIPDVSIMYYLKECDAAFMGAETFFPDGTGFNTIGSDIVGLVCYQYNIPLYFLTPFIKLDFRPAFGHKKALVINDMGKKLTKDWKQEIDTGKIDFLTPELVGVEAKYIKGYVTEKGIIPSNQMYEISFAYSNNLKGDIL
ncbi:ribose 1,5-bisphosphate isomerase [Ruminiclostridium sufflavum DSM 19573]|uniref:Ribose 1,5-bisphosphate isomerase n=1 Tax=Ruminiclostridium sufflavum DSM 19573 TaxID=1121337 RepID=A0A318XKH0_9FIRM|nr:hypothetical protein [Ruminiclostridium sufflavum]PYG87925.1 ribose 1,5-bisphosphate isomerase [Ruminiclostridium sufflavum DSM 19573]